MTVDVKVLTRAVLCLLFLAFLAYTEQGATLLDAGVRTATQVFTNVIAEPLLERAQPPTTTTPASVQP